jgi:hypothetical protein
VYARAICVFLYLISTNSKRQQANGGKQN